MDEGGFRGGGGCASGAGRPAALGWIALALIASAALVAFALQVTTGGTGILWRRALSAGLKGIGTVAAAAFLLVCVAAIFRAAHPRR